MNARRTLPLVLSVLLLFGGCRAVAQEATAEELVASGTIRATEVRIAGELGGRIVSIPHTTGQEVAAGEVLVTLDATPYLLQLSPAEAGIATAQAKLDQVRAGPRQEEIDAARAALQLAEAQRDSAWQAWQDALAVVQNPQAINTQIIDAQTQVDLAAQGVEQARAQLERQRVLSGLHAEGSVERQADELQLQAAEEALAAAQANQQTAQALLTHLQQMKAQPLGYIAQAHAAEGQYRAAEAGVTVAKAKLADLLSRPTPEEVAVAEAAVRQAEAEAAVLKAKIAKCTITSPISGTIVSQAMRPGEIAAPAAPILTLADLSVVHLTVYVPENRVGEVHLGQAVSVTVDSFPGRSFAGRLTRISDRPEFTPRNVATTEGRLNTFYAVEIRVPNPARLLKPGMPADARFAATRR